jgi:hypothetical protein
LPAARGPEARRRLPMSEFLRNAAIMTMGLAVIGAGVIVVFYG